MSGVRYLLLAEGFSADPHYGKTARGVLRYRRDDVVAILDSKRVGEIEEGVPVVATVVATRCGSTRQPRSSGLRRKADASRPSGSRS